jgi:hypothetical protein
MRFLHLRLVPLCVLLGLSVSLLFGTAQLALAGPDVVGQQKISATSGNLNEEFCYNPYFGYSSADIGDLNGDGVTDIIVGAPHTYDNSAYHGAVWILMLNDTTGGTSPGTVKAKQKIGDGIGGFPTGLLPVDGWGYGPDFGHAVTGLGDLDGDGFVDVAVGAPYDDTGGNNNGAVWILFLNSNGTVKNYQKINNSETGGDNFGFALASLGDLDGDGVTDLAVGAILDDDGGSPSSGDEGALWILFLNNDGTAKSRKKISRTQGGFTPITSFKHFGRAVESIGDLDGNGVTDLAVGGGGISSSDSKGYVYILFLTENHTVEAYQEIPESATSPPYTNFGHSVSLIGDISCTSSPGLGGPLLAVGAIWNNDVLTQSGAIHLFYLNQDGTVLSEEKITQGQGGFTGTLHEKDYFGCSVTPLGDLDKNGFIDFAVGAWGDPDEACPSMNWRAGAMWVLFTDCTVPVALQAFDSRWTGQHVEVAWRLTGIDGPLAFEIYRKELSRETYERMNDAQIKRNGDEFTFTDPGASPGGTYVYRVDVLQDGETMTSFETTVTIPSAEFTLEQNVPNPFNPATRIDFSVSEPSTVTLTIYDVAGRIVTELMNETVNAGVHSKEWDGRDSRGEHVASGIYFYRLTAGNRTLMRKAVLLK